MPLNITNDTTRALKYLGYPITNNNRVVIRDALIVVRDVIGNDEDEVVKALYKLDSLTAITPISYEKREAARQTVQDLSVSINVSIYRDIFSTTNQMIRG